LGEDVAQDFFIKQGKINHIYVENPSAWVYKSCENLAKNYFHKYSKYDAACTLEANEVEYDSVEDFIISQGNEKLDLLDEKTKSIFILKIYYGYSLKEVATVLNMSHDNVRQKYVRGIKKLKSGK
jgi:RNA polymerase sigma factor (sigma-70 family)